MTETLAAFLATAGLVAMVWTVGVRRCGRAMFAGAVMALGALCRPALLLWTIAIGIVLAGMCWRLHRSYGRRLPTPIHTPRNGSATGVASYKCLAALAMLFLGAAIVLSPWAIRNQIQFGRPIVTTTHGGYTLLLANNPEFYQWLRSGSWGSVWQADEFNAAWDRRKPARRTAGRSPGLRRSLANHSPRARHVCLRLPGPARPLLVAAAAPGSGRRNARPPCFTLCRGGVVRVGVSAGGRVCFQLPSEKIEGGRRKVEGGRRIGVNITLPSPFGRWAEGEGDRRLGGPRCPHPNPHPKGEGTSSPVPLPPSPFLLLALGLAVGRIPNGRSHGVLDRHADAGAADARSGAGCGVLW